MTFDEYQAIEAINATSIKAGRTSMRHMRHTMTGGGKKTTAAMAWGKMIHAAVLDAAFIDSLAVWTGSRRQGKAFDAWAEENAGRTTATVAERDELASIRFAAMADQTVRRLLDATEHEQVTLWTGDGYGNAKAMLDGWGDDVGVIEVKSTSAISADGFARQALSMGYDLQFGWYAEGARAQSHRANRPPVTVIAIEPVAPFCVWALPVPSLMIETGYKRAAEIATRYRQCEAAGVWPGPVDGMTELPLPEWYLQSEVAEGFFADAAAEGLGV